MTDDYKISILGAEFECLDKGFGKNKPVDVVIRPEDIEVIPSQNAKLSGEVVDTVFKGVHYEMSVMCNNCLWLIHSTKCSLVGSTVGMNFIPDNIHIMNKLFPTANNEFEAVVASSSKEENSMELIIENCRVPVSGHFFDEGKALNVVLPPSGVYIAGDGVGHLNEVYIESVIYKGEHNEIILESDEHKWLMQSDQDEQVATYVPICFNFEKAVFTEIASREGSQSEN